MNDKPVNKLAGIVSGKGEGYQQSYQLTRTHSKTKIPVGQYLGDKHDDLTGKRKGMLTVISISLHQPKKQEGNP